MAADAAPAATAGDGQQEAAQQGGLDPAAIEAQFAQVTGGMNDLRQLVQGIGEQLQQPQDEGHGQEPEPLDLSEFLDPEGGDPQDMAQRLQEAIQQQIQQGIEQGLTQHVQPLREGLDRMRMDADAERLVAEFPVLGENPEAAQQVFDAARAAVEANGWPAELATHPAFIRGTVLQAIGARALAEEGGQDESASDAGAATLEGAAGAVPGGGSGAMTGAQIVGAGPRSVLPF